MTLPAPKREDSSKRAENPLARSGTMPDIVRLLSQPGSVLLDSSDETSERESGMLFSSPRHILSCARPCDVPGMLADLDAWISDGYYVAGYLAYECGYAFTTGRFEEPASTDWADQIGYPILWFGVYDAPLRVTSDELVEAFGPSGDHSAGAALSPTMSREKYLACISTVKALIREGDVYQVNYTMRFEGESKRNAFELYASMRGRQPVSYAAFIQLGDVQLLSASPECFFTRARDRIWTRPMKGTAPRGQTAKEDEFLSGWLHVDEKSRAENLMIVDLVRNDLSRICEPGSVKVPSLFQIEKYRTLLQMTSTVEGRLKKGISYSDIFRALFPCGSITGAPKIRSIGRINELENRPRGVYCGAIGYMAPDKTASFSVSIRSLSLAGGRIVFGSGGGIVWDSEPHEEYEECLLKTRFLTGRGGAAEEATKIIETMCWDDGIALLDEHLERLEATAAILDFRFDRSNVSRAVDDAVRLCVQGVRFRVRLLMGVDGTCDASVHPLPAPPSSCLTIGVAAARVHSSDPFLRVKTTRRMAFGRAAREAESRGLDEILLVNERGEITEGTVTNVFVRLLGQWRTPPVSAGLLPGLARRRLLGTMPGATETLVTIEDVYQADEILLTNAVWGVREAVIQRRGGV